jgi:hypothetical protein
MGEAFAVALALGLAMALFWERSSQPQIAAMGAPVGVLSALYAGLWILGLPPHIPPNEALDRLLLIVLPAAAVAEMIGVSSCLAGWVARCVVAALTTPVLLQGSVYVCDLSGSGSREWPPAKAWLIFALLAVVLMAMWTAINRLSVRTGGRLAVLCVTGPVLGAGLVVMLSGYASGGQLGVPLSAGLGGVALGSVAWKAQPASECAVGIGVVGLFALLVVGRLFAGLTELHTALVLVAPLLGWLPEFLPWRRGRAALRLGFVAAPVVVALVLAQQKFAADSAQPGSPSEGSIEDYRSFGK